MDRKSVEIIYSTFEWFANPFKSVQQKVSQTIRTLSRLFVIRAFLPFKQSSVSDSFAFHSHKC